MTTPDMMLFKIVVELARLTAEKGSTSGKRTKYAHDALGNMMVKWNPRLIFKIEYKIITPIGTYTVDIALFDKNTNEPVAFILCKFSMCNIGQNLTNGQNSVIGEMRKADANYPNVPIFTLNIYPKEAPKYKSNGTIEKIEILDVDKYKKQARGCVRMARDNPADNAFLFFVNNTCKSKKDIVCESIADFTDLDMMKATIEKLVPV
jgi:hypothetical protein